MLNHLKQGLNILTNPDNEYLAKYRFSNGFGFPSSYVKFATTLGWGRLCNLFLIYIPLPVEHPDSWQEQSKMIKGYMEEFYSDIDDEDLEFLFEPDGSIALVENAVPFAMSENGEYLVWDILNADENGEFPIYVLASRMGGIRYGGKDLFDFISSCIDDVRIKKSLGEGYNKLPLVFEPLSLN